MEGFDIRFSELDDLAYLTTWLSFPNACDDFPFNENETEDALKNWIGFSKFKASLTGTIKDVPCAIGTLFLMPYKKVAHQCSFYLIVDPEHRRKGIGTSMVRNLVHLAKTRFKLEGMNAELFLPCNLETILDRLEFKVFARQEDFVKLGPDQYRPRLLMESFFT
ncbi:MAG TPA: GNAT family N-acetyltransferase [Chlamydiales bacterium]|nr:GNAT family N-acetyltransferase [Chlamydiales bacterium]